MDGVSKAGALGGRVMVSGRLNGAEIAREEAVSFGSIPLQNLRADINYALDEAQTIYGKIGIKVWGVGVVGGGEQIGKRTSHITITLGER